MLFENPYIFFFCALGVFNCFLVSLYFLFIGKKSRLENLLFGILTLLLSIRVGKTLYMSFSGSNELMVAQIGLSACFLIGISLYFYLRSSLENLQQIPKSWKVYFAILFAIILIVGLIKPYSESIAFWHSYFVWFIYFVWGTYLILSGVVLKTILTNLIKDAKKVPTNETWLAMVFIGNVLIFFSYLIGYFWLYFAEMLTFSFVFYALIIYYLIKKDRDLIFQGANKKYAHKKIEKGEAESLKSRLSSLMINEQPYKSPDLKLKELSARMNISQHKLSQLLNDNMGVSFSSYVNQYRVENAILLLKENQLITLEAIGYDSGFTSKSGFYATFKKITGKTPSKYRQQFI